MKENNYLVTQMSLRYQFGEDVKTLFAMTDYYKQLSAAAIQEAARTYLKRDRFVRVTLLPESVPEKK
jgi:predicted Zn-dependent peptidase